MALSPIAPTTEKPVSPLLLKAELPEVYNEEVSETKPAEQEIVIFAQKAQYAAEAPKFTATSKPTFEHTGAAAASVHTQPLPFTTNSEGRFVAATGFAHAGGVSTELASALSAPSENSRGGDKHDDGSPQYVSAQKSLVDIRHGRLGEPIKGGIFSMYG